MTNHSINDPELTSVTIPGDPKPPVGYTIPAPPDEQQARASIQKQAAARNRHQAAARIQARLMAEKLPAALSWISWAHTGELDAQLSDWTEDGRDLAADVQEWADYLGVTPTWNAYETRPGGAFSAVKVITHGDIDIKVKVWARLPEKPADIAGATA